MSSTNKKKRSAKGKKKQNKIQKLGSPTLRIQPICDTEARSEVDREKLVNSQAWKAFCNKAFFTFRLMHRQAAAIAANQLNCPYPAWVWEPEGRFEIVLDPKISVFDDEEECDKEGCLSLPGEYFDIVRYKTILLEGYNHFGEPLEPREFTGFEARIAQHEYEHLCGGLIIDHLSDTDKCAYLDKERRGLGFV